MAKAEVIKSVVASQTFRCGAIDIMAPIGADRSVQSIRLNSICTPKGSPVSLSVADFKKGAEAVVEARPERVANSLKRACSGKIGTLFVGVNPRPAFTETVTVTTENGLTVDQETKHEAETQEAMIQAELELVLAFCEKYKPVTTSGPKLRVVSDEVVKGIADLALVIAGITGKIPSKAEVMVYLTDARMEKGMTEAANKAERLKLDSLGQFLLRAERGTGTVATPAPAEAATEAADEATSETDEVEIVILTGDEVDEMEEVEETD